MGGLGLRLTSTFDNILLSKVGWTLLRINKSVWKLLLFDKYVKDSSWLSILPKPIDSWFWKGLLKQRDIIASSFCFQINNGANTKAWSDPWIPTISPPIPKPSLDIIRIDPHMRVSKLVLEEPRRWNTILLETLFSQTTVNEIEKTPLAQHQFHNIIDNLKWLHHSIGKLSVKSAYVALTIQSNTTTSLHPPTIWKKLWSLKL